MLYRERERERLGSPRLNRKRKREMAMQSGVGLSKLIFMVGAGYAGTILASRLPDILRELQDILQSDKPVDPSDPDYSGVAAQVHRLAMEVRQLALARPITVLNGDSGQMGSITSLAMPAAALGALGYGYMWWKGFSFSDLMYVTKRNMTTAVSSMTKHLEQVSAAIAATKKHLTQRIENLDGKLDEQNEISKLIKNEVTDVRTDLSQIGFDLETLQKLVCGLDGKINTLVDKQDFANAGVWYLCQFVDAKDGKLPELLQGVPKPTNKRGFLGYLETKSLKGLQQIADAIGTGTNYKFKNDAIMQNDSDGMDKNPICLSRTASIKCC